MKLQKIFLPLIAVALMLGASACKDSKSYAELLNEETKSVNAFSTGPTLLITVLTKTVTCSCR